MSDPEWFTPSGTCEYCGDMLRPSTSSMHPMCATLSERPGHWDGQRFVPDMNNEAEFRCDEMPTGKGQA